MYELTKEQREAILKRVKEIEAGEVGLPELYARRSYLWGIFFMCEQILGSVDYDVQEAVINTADHLKEI